MATETATASATAAPGVAKKKQRSPNYPAIGLSTAIELARKLYDNAKRSLVSEAVAVTAMGYKGLNGTTRGHLSALRKYGLVDDDGGNLKISELAMRILINQPGSPERQAAVVEAAFKPEIFKEIHQSHGDVGDQVLTPYLILQKQFSQGGAEQFIQAFRDTMALAQGAGQGYDAAMNPGIQTGTTPPPVAPGNPGRPQPRPLSLPLDEDTVAEVRIIGGNGTLLGVTTDYLDALIEYLTVAKRRLGERAKKDEAAAT
jgi:hypothetical protein